MQVAAASMLMGDCSAQYTPPMRLDKPASEAAAHFPSGTSPSMRLITSACDS